MEAQNAIKQGHRASDCSLGGSARMSTSRPSLPSAELAAQDHSLEAFPTIEKSTDLNGDVDAGVAGSDGSANSAPPTFIQDFLGFFLGLWTLALSLRKELTLFNAYEFLKLRFPPLVWIPQYNLEKLRLDVTAGLVVGCMLIPQGMAYAGVAGLPPQYGLYTGFAPLIIYCSLGTSRQMGVGPVAIISLLLSQGIPACSKVCTPTKIPSNYTWPDPYPNCLTKCPTGQTLNWNPEYQFMASSVALMSGVILVVISPALGWAMNFCSYPVILGFTTGGGIMIALGQLKDVMGYSIRKDRLQEGIYDFFSSLPSTHGPTCTMGVLAAFFLFVVRKLGQGRLLWWKSSRVPNWVKAAALLPWPFGLVVLYTGVSANMNLSSKGVAIVGIVPPGLPPFGLPQHFNDNISKLISVTITITICGYLESIAVETKFANQFKYQINPTQEAFAQGWANIFGGLTLAYPAVGSFSRSATNAAYGSKSPVCNFVTAMVIMVCLLVLTPYLYNMPKVILASIVIVAALSLTEWPEVVFLWKTNKKDWALCMIVMNIVLWNSLETGIYVGFALCGLEVLVRSTFPKVVHVDESKVVIYLPGSTGTASEAIELAPVFEPYGTEIGLDTLICKVDGQMIFASAGQVKRMISTGFPAVFRKNHTTKFILDLTDLEMSDSTTLRAIVGILENVQSYNIRTCIVGFPKNLELLMHHESVAEMFTGVDRFETPAKMLSCGWLTEIPPDTTLAIKDVDGTSPSTDSGLEAIAGSTPFTHADMTIVHDAHAPKV